MIRELVLACGPRDFDIQDLQHRYPPGTALKRSGSCNFEYLWYVFRTLLIYQLVDCSFASLRVLTYGSKRTICQSIRPHAGARNLLIDPPRLVTDHTPRTARLSQTVAIIPCLSLFSTLLNFETPGTVAYLDCFRGAFVLLLSIKSGKEFGIGLNSNSKRSRSFSTGMNGCLILFSFITRNHV